MSADTIGHDSKGRLWRSRWAAIGAAVAVTFGAGGLVAVNAAPSAPSSVVTIDPARILDTRTDKGLAGPFVSAVPRKLQVTGASVPAGATGVLLNVTVVSPSAAGFVSIRPGDATGSPSTSSLNFEAGVSALANAVQVQLPTSGANTGQIDITYDAFGVAGPTTELLIDVVGYMVDGGGGATGPAGPQGPAGTAAAYAYVAANGSISRDSGNISVTRIADGTYCVGVSGATVHIAVANLDSRKNVGGSVQTGVFNASGCPAAQRDIFVITRDQARDGGSPGNDKAFYILVN